MLGIFKLVYRCSCSRRHSVVHVRWFCSKNIKTKVYCPHACQGGNRFYWKLISAVDRSGDVFVSHTLQDFRGPAKRCERHLPSCTLNLLLSCKLPLINVQARCLECKQWSLKTVRTPICSGFVCSLVCTCAVGRGGKESAVSLFSLPLIAFSSNFRLLFCTETNLQSISKRSSRRRRRQRFSY